MPKKIPLLDRKAVSKEFLIKNKFNNLTNQKYNFEKISNQRIKKWVKFVEEYKMHMKINKFDNFNLNEKAIRYLFECVESNVTFNIETLKRIIQEKSN